MILVGEMRDLETIGNRADRRRDRPPRLRDAAHAERAADDRPRHRRLPRRAAGPGSRPARPATLQGVVTQTLVPTADGRGRVAALEILIPDDAVRNLIRQGKIEQIYSGMQTGTASGMQTMEQSLASLVLRHVITREEAINRSSRPEMLVGLIERGVSLGRRRKLPSPH